jgi:hypothetical protein
VGEAHTVRRSPRRVRLVACTVLVALAALMLVWIGRASADAEPTATISKTVSNVATSRADAVDANDLQCTTSVFFSDMPGMSEAFSLGGRDSRPVLVLFQASWHDLAERTQMGIRLTVDGALQSGPTPLVQHRALGEPPFAFETNGFTFISDPVAPGPHTASIQWRVNEGFGCVGDRSLIVLHK